MLFSIVVKPMWLCIDTYQYLAKKLSLLSVNV